MNRNQLYIILNKVNDDKVLKLNFENRNDYISLLNCSNEYFVVENQIIHS